MLRKKKVLIIAAVVAAVIMVGSLSTIVFAQSGTSENTTSGKSLLARVADILGIDQQRLEDAVKQAKQEMQDEAISNYLDKLVENGKITREQADRYENWWQSRPDDFPPGFGIRGRGGFHGYGKFRIFPGGGGGMGFERFGPLNTQPDNGLSGAPTSY